MSPAGAGAPRRARHGPPGPLLEVTGRAGWRAWLRRHRRARREVWLVFWKKHTGKAALSYNDAVEEALCFGWIDSTVRRLDDDRYAQRFTPRNPKTPYSQANRERLRSLVRAGRVAKDVLASLGELDDSSFTVAPDILAALRASPAAWRNFRRLPPAYVRIRVGFIEGARTRPAELAKRLRHFVAMTARGRRYGYGGIEKHFGAP